MEDVFAGDWPGRAKHWHFAAAKGRGRHRHVRRIEDLERFAALRELRGGGGPFGGRGRRRRGDVRTALLLLLAEEPRNGYQLMQEIEQRSDGRWRPSPGSVYPTLAQLEDEGLVHATERDGAKLFELTDAGREQVAEAAEASPPWVGEEEEAGFHDLRRLIPDVARAAAQVSYAGTEQQIARAIETMKDARRSLYRILADDEDE
jgi:DNA-binding PadR family transcriptional regulator